MVIQLSVDRRRCIDANRGDDLAPPSAPVRAEGIDL
jgi:hypothetical protein